MLPLVVEVDRVVDPRDEDNTDGIESAPAADSVAAAVDADDAAAAATRRAAAIKLDRALEEEEEGPPAAGDAVPLPLPEGAAAEGEEG